MWAPPLLCFLERDEPAQSSRCVTLGNFRGFFPSFAGLHFASVYSKELNEVTTVFPDQSFNSVNWTGSIVRGNGVRDLEPKERAGCPYHFKMKHFNFQVS